MTRIFFIALGGALGSVLRYGVQTWLNGAHPLPLGTLAVNVIGCFAIGFLAGMWMFEPTSVREEYRLAIIVGVLGGFTTFSAFGLETYKLASTRQLTHALLNITLSVGLGLTATWVGARLAVLFTR